MIRSVISVLLSFSVDVNEGFLLVLYTVNWETQQLSGTIHPSKLRLNYSVQQKLQSCCYSILQMDANTQFEDV